MSGGNFDHFDRVDAAAKRTLVARLYSLLDWLGPEHFPTEKAEAIFHSQSIYREDAEGKKIPFEDATKALPEDSIEELPLAHALATAFPVDHARFDQHNLISIWVFIEVMRERQIGDLEDQSHKEALRAVRFLREKDWGARFLSGFDPDGRHLKTVLDCVDDIIKRGEFSDRPLDLIERIRAVLARLEREGTPPRPERLPLLKYASEIVSPPEFLEPDADDARVRVIRTRVFGDGDGESKAISPDVETHSDLCQVEPRTDPGRRASPELHKRFARGAVQAMQMRQSRARSLWHGFTIAEREHVRRTCVTKLKVKPDDESFYYLEFLLSLLFGRSVENLRDAPFLKTDPSDLSVSSWWSRNDATVELCFRPELPDLVRPHYKDLLAEIKIRPLRLRVPPDFQELAREYLNSSHQLMPDQERTRVVWNRIWKGKGRTPVLGRLREEAFHALMELSHDSAATSHLTGQLPKQNRALHYASIELGELARAHARIGFHPPGQAEFIYPPGGHAGSTLQAHRAVLRELFPAIEDHLAALRKDPKFDLQAFHNRYVAIAFLVLSIATAHREVRAPFENVRDFDIEGEWLFIDDKEVRGAGSSRVIPLTLLAKEQFLAWRRHLKNLAPKIPEPKDPVGLAIAAALSGEKPLLFFWEERGAAIVTPGKLEEYLKEIFPLPLNWPRHFWRTALRGQVSDEAMNALMGHTELFGAPFGSGSTLSLHELEPLRKVMNKELARIGARPAQGLMT